MAGAAVERALRRFGGFWEPGSPSIKSAAGTYTSHSDLIEVPRRPISGQARWARTALHELGHATGTRDRTSREYRTRPVIARRGYNAFTRWAAREEIVAELISYRVAKRLGVPPVPGRGGSRRYVGSYTRLDQPESGATAYGRGGRYGERSRGEAKSIMADVREGERMVLDWAIGGGLARARPQLGGGN